MSSGPPPTTPPLVPDPVSDTVVVMEMDGTFPSAVTQSDQMLGDVSTFTSKALFVILSGPRLTEPVFFRLSVRHPHLLILPQDPGSLTPAVVFPSFVLTDRPIVVPDSRFAQPLMVTAEMRTW